MEEEWKSLKDIIGGGDYYVSTTGRIYNAKTGNYLSGHVHKNGYILMHFCINNKHSAYWLHRLVAMAFIPNPDNLPQVNHKDFNTQNASVDNLEWCSDIYNKEYSKQTRAIIKYDMDGNVIEEYHTIADAANKNNISRSGLCKHLSHGIIENGYHGYIWKYNDPSYYEGYEDRRKRYLDKKMQEYFRNKKS